MKRRVLLLAAALTLIAGCLLVSSCSGDPTVDAQPRLRSEAPLKGAWYFTQVSFDTHEVETFSFTLNDDGSVEGVLPSTGTYPDDAKSYTEWSVVTTNKEIDSLSADEVEASDLIKIEIDPSSEDSDWLIFRYYKNSRGSEILALCEWGEDSQDWYGCKPCYKSPDQAVNIEEW